MSELQMAIQLRRDLETGEWQVLKVEAMRGAVKSQLSFRCAIPIAQAFTTEVTAFLLSIVPIQLQSAVKSLGNRKFLNIDVAFDEVYVVAQRAFAGMQSVTVRINRVFGQVANIYRPIAMISSDPVIETEELPIVEPKKGFVLRHVKGEQS